MATRYPLLMLTLLLSLCCGHSLYAQQLLVSEIEGLSNNYITAVAKDGKGMLWIGTQKSVVTFDGYSVKEVAFFRNMRINCFAYDSSRNAMWIGSNKGLFRFDALSGEVVDATEKARAKAVTGIVVSGADVYVSFYRGRVLQLQQDGRVQQIANVSPRGLQPVWQGNRIACDASGRLYMAAAGYHHLLRYDAANHKWELMSAVAISNPRNITASGNLMLIDEGEQGFALLDMRTCNRLQLPAVAIDKNYALTLANGIVYIHDLGRSVLTVLDPLLKKPAEMPAVPEARKSPKEATCLFVDEEGIAWSGTNRGLLRLVNHQLPVFHELLNEKAQYSIRQIIEPRSNEFYICTYQGLFYYNANTQQHEALKTLLPDGELLPNARAVLAHPDGYIYFGAESVNQPFYRYDEKKRVFEKAFYRKADPADSFFVLSMEKDRDGIIWIGTNKGLVSYNPHINLLQRHHGDVFDLGGMDILFLRATGDGRMYGAGSKGVFTLDPRKGITERFNASGSPALFDEKTLFAADDHLGNTWIGSRNAGIQVIDKNRQHVRMLSVNDGLSSNEVYSILWQDTGTAWISTANGLCRYQQATHGFNNYFADDGISDNEFNQNSCLRSSNGTFYFGGINGITWFRPADMPVTRKSFSIYASNISKWNGSAADFSEVKPADNGSLVNMRASDHLLTFSLGSSDHSFPEKVMFFYSIDDLGNNWISLGKDHTLRLEGLSAGKHTLHIRAYNKDGIYAANTLQYQIRIAQAFYKTWWFIVLLILAVAGLVYAYVSNRIRNLKKLQQLRSEISRNLHDEVGGLLTGIALSADNGRYKSGTLEAKDQRLEKVSALSRLATDTMSDVLWAIDSRNDHTGDLIDRMREHAEELFGDTGIDWSFNVRNANPGQFIKPELRQNSYLIFKEALNNIVKHSHADKVEIMYAQSAGRIALSIRNNHPKPREQAGVHQGQGLKNIALRAKAIGAAADIRQDDGWFSVTVKSV